MTAIRSHHDSASASALEHKLHALSRARIKILKPLKTIEAEIEQLVNSRGPESELTALRRQRYEYVRQLRELNDEFEMIRRRLAEVKG